MLNEQIAKDILEKIDSSKAPEKPQRYVEYSLSSSFAHCTPNLTSDEIHGYALVDLIKERSGNLAMLLEDYDGTFPEKEKPLGDRLETNLKDRDGKEQFIPIFFDYGRTIENQEYRPDQIIRSTEEPFDNLVKNTGFSKENKSLVAQRFSEVIKSIRTSASQSKSTLDFLQNIRKRFLSLAGINSSGTPASLSRDLYAQKLEEDLEAGFPFWKMDLPDVYKHKHKSNGTTYLFRAKSHKGELCPVKFFENPDRFQFQRNGEVESVLAEESPNAMKKGILIPTLSVLSYISLSPARKDPGTDSLYRIHLAGQFMAGADGYARKLIPYFNKVPGFDEVELVCTGHDGSLLVEEKLKKRIGFGVVYPQFGKAGIQQSLKKGSPHTLQRTEVYHE